MTFAVIVAVDPVGFSRIRPPVSVTTLVLIVRPPLVFVRAAPVIVPPVHVVAPLTVTLSVPPSVPEPDSVNALRLTGDPVTKFNVPPLTVVNPVGEYEIPVLKLVVPPDTVTAPAPVTLAGKLKVFVPVNCSVAPAETVNTPVFVLADAARVPV